VRKAQREQEEVIALMDIEILSLFPEYFSGPFDESMIKRARNNGILNIRQVNIRDFAEQVGGNPEQKRVDDRPYGGGPGMVLMAGPVKAAVESVRRVDSHVVYLSPQGALLTPEKCKSLSAKPHLILLCGHYEGIDQRAIDAVVDEEISIGDYVLTNGCIAAIVLVDAVARFLPGVIGHEKSAAQDSFEEGILDCPHYTHPPVVDGVKVPEVLLSGNHELIAKWRKAQALKKTQEVRNDLYLGVLAQGSEVETVSSSEAKLGVTLSVTDLKKSAQFYVKTVGLKKTYADDKRVRFAEGLNLSEGKAAGTDVNANAALILQVMNKESFEKIAVRLMRSGVAVGKLQINEEEGQRLVFTDRDGYPWVLKELCSLKEKRDE
jgi:tRNA (guanine37-N1)-methyltransferase